MHEIILRLVTQIPAFLFAIVIHEWAHAYIAFRFGDPTAKAYGRLTLNPMAHIDPIGTVVFPLLGVVTGSVMFGWAKPVPVDFRYFKNFRKSTFWVSFAGPLANIIIAFISAVFFTFMLAKIPQNFYLYKPLIEIMKNSVYINIILAAFNLIPLPPLDGSKMVSSFLSYPALVRYEALANYSFIFLLLMLFTNVLSYILTPAIWAGEIMTGLLYRFWLMV